MASCLTIILFPGVALLVTMTQIMIINKNKKTVATAAKLEDREKATRRVE